jgi:soluble cytochrome b562
MPAPLGSTIPEAPDLPEEERVAAVDAQKQFEEDQFAAALEDQGRADERATDFQADTDELVRLIDEAIVDQDEDRVRFLTELKDAKEAIQGMPEEVTSEFNRLRDEFGVEADASFDRLDTQLADALAGAEEGRSEAMQAAVQGLQGTVNSEVAKIMANPNLTQSQKQSMVSQVRLTGASAIAPVIGQTVLAFNKLSADIAMSFGTTFGALEGTVINAKGQLIGAQGQAFTQVQIAIGTITAQLLDVDASASASYTTAQSQLLATRSHATLTGNQLLLDLLPEQGTPYLDITGSTMLDYVTKDNSVRGQFAMDLQSTGMDITVAMLQADQGNPWWDVAMGFIQGGPAGGAVAIADTIFNPQGPDI